MVWGGIMGRRKTHLIVVQGNLNAQGYINQILQPEAVPFLQRHGPAILMHDNTKANFLSGVFSPLTSAEVCEKSSRWLWKEKLC